MKLKIDKLTFSYNSKPVIRDVCFDFPSGQITGIIGPNGAGKTTLLNCIDHILKPTAGSIYISPIPKLSNPEKIIKLQDLSQKEIARLIGFVAQREIISAPFSVYDIILMGRYPHLKSFSQETDHDYAVVEQIIKLLDIDQLRHKLIGEISGGEFKKVMIARALVQEPKILLLDEPTLHLDINHQIEILDIISNLAKEKAMTVILVTHDLFWAAKYCDQLLILKENCIYKAGSFKEVIQPQIIREVYNLDVEILKSGYDDEDYYIIPKKRLIYTKNAQVSENKLHDIASH